MEGLKIILGTRNLDDIEPEKIQKDRAQRIMFWLAQWDKDFQFLNEHITDAFIIITKFYYKYQIDELLEMLEIQGIKTGISTEEFQICQEKCCYKEIAAPSIANPVFDRHGEEYYKIHEYCEEHTGASRCRRLLRTIETIEVRPGERWIKIQVWKWPLFWIAQKIWQEWDYTGPEGGYSTHPYDCASPWLLARTKEEAIELARNYK